MDILTDGQTDIWQTWINRHMGRGIGRQTDRQVYTQTNRLTDDNSNWDQQRDRYSGR